MRMAIACALLAAPVQASVETALTDHVMPGFDRFAAEAKALDTAARADCTADALRPAYHDVFDAWMGVSHLSLGPLERDGRQLAITFWPDSRGMVPRTLAGLIAEADPVVRDVDAFAEVSVAARGLFALERLLFDPVLSGYAPASYRCALAQAITADLARMATAIEAEWDGFAGLMRSPGAANNTRFLTDREPALALYTALDAGLEFTIAQRLGRPLGTFDRPRPTRAEAHRSDRSLRNVVLSVEALRELARALADGPIPQVEQAAFRALAAAEQVAPPDFAGVTDPASRLKVEILQQRVALMRQAVAVELGQALGLFAGFNSLDGD